MLPNLDKITLRSKYDLVDDYWHPRIIGELNGQYVKIAKIKGEFVWHDHANEDELFFVVQGRFRMEFRDRTVFLAEGDMLIVPRGVEHRPVADEECWIMLFEPAETLHTGTVQSERTVSTDNQYKI